QSVRSPAPLPATSCWRPSSAANHRTPACGRSRCPPRNAQSSDPALRNNFLPPELYPAGSFLLREILEQEQPALARDHNIGVAVAVDIHHRNLHAAAGPRAVVDYMLDPFHLSV